MESIKFNSPYTSTDKTNKNKYTYTHECSLVIILLEVFNSDYILQPRGELSYFAPLGSENISAPYFKQCFFPGGRYYPPQTEPNTTPPSPKTEITNILFYILNFASIIKFKM